MKIFSVCLLLSITAFSQAATDSTELLKKINHEINNIDTETLKKIIEDDPDMVLIDVRMASEISLMGGGIDADQNINIPRGLLEFRIADFVSDKDTQIVVYCGSNLRSPLATKSLMSLGYKNVKNYQGGAIGWKKKNLPLRPVDFVLDSILFKKPQEVTKTVYSAIGETGPPSIENSGHNNNLSFVIGENAVLVMNAGGNYLLAQSLHKEIKKVTDKPVKYVVLENAQGHAILGSNYWQEQGATIIAHELAKKEIKEHGIDIFDRAQRRLLDKIAFTEVVLPEQTFSKKLDIDLGNKKVSVLYLGPAHGPGDIVVWIPDDKLVITGDVAFHERLLPVFESTSTKGWLQTWKKLEDLGAEIVIPGHGGPTNMDEVRKYTKDYLEFMRAKVSILIEDGKSSVDVHKIDQSKYKHLDTYEYLYRLNAARIFAEMEFE